MKNCIHNGKNCICKDSPDVRFSKKEHSDLDILFLHQDNFFQKLERLCDVNARSTQSYLMQREHSKSDASTRVVGISLEVSVVFSGKTSPSK